MTDEQCKEVQESWTSGSTPIIAATNAFGMGTDEPDLGLVVHYSMYTFRYCRMCTWRTGLHTPGLAY